MHICFSRAPKYIYKSENFNKNVTLKIIFHSSGEEVQHKKYINNNKSVLV